MNGSEDDTYAISTNIDVNVVDGINIDIEHATIVLLLDAFILNPLELGCDRFFYKNLDEPAEMAKIRQLLRLQLENEGFTLNRSKTDICELVRECAAGAYTDIENAGMNMDADIPEECIEINADRLQ